MHLTVDYINEVRRRLMTRDTMLCSTTRGADRKLRVAVDIRVVSRLL